MRINLLLPSSLLPGTSCALTIDYSDGRCGLIDCPERQVHGPCDPLLVPISNAFSRISTVIMMDPLEATDGDITVQQPPPELRVNDESRTDSHHNVSANPSELVSDPFDVSEEVSDISQYPFSGGGFCDVHTGNIRGGGKVAMKKLRFYGNREKAEKVARFFFSCAFSCAFFGWRDVPAGIVFVGRDSAS